MSGKQPLELYITRKGRRESVLQVTADPADSGALRDILVTWLEGGGWARGHWPGFEMTVFAAGSSRRLARVRA